MTSHFTVSEFDCKDGTPVPYEFMDNLFELMLNLEVIREAIGGRPIKITSGYRTPSHNQAEGGAPRSRHLTAEAGDLQVVGGLIRPRELYDVIEGLISSGKVKEGGLGLYNTFVHYDRRGYRRRWNIST